MLMRSIEHILQTGLLEKRRILLGVMPAGFCAIITH